MSPKASIEVAVQEKHQKIYSLSDQGFSLVEISKMLDMFKGEVELILNLRLVFKKDTSYVGS